LSQPRQPRGTPVGGQWRAAERAEGRVRLQQGGAERVLRIQAADPAKSLERTTERLHLAEDALRRVEADGTLSPAARAALTKVCTQRIRGLRAAYTRAFRQLADAGPQGDT